MMPSEVQEAQWSQLSALIAERMGLDFPRARWDDLERGVAGAAQELGFEDAAACVERLLSAPPTKAQVQVLASHLTIGETYFFRDMPMMEALAENILPALIRTRRGREQRLRLWSAACCTGEEPYSLAILLHQLLPDLQSWHITITATDINGRFLHKAAAGVYGEWSFRDAPAGLKERYFRRTADGRYAIRPEIRKLVTFEHLNLVEDVYPSLATYTNATDLIFCRNVLMYLTPSQTRKVIRNLHHALVEGGWLAVSPSEASHSLFSRFDTVNFPGAILYRKSDAKLRTDQRWMPAPLNASPEFVGSATETPEAWVSPAPAALRTELPPAMPEEPLLVETPFRSHAAAESLYLEGRYAEAADVLLAAFDRHEPDSQGYSLLVRALANLGRLVDALAWCDRWIAADKLNSAGHYLRAVILSEQGEPKQVRASLQRSLYLQPDFVLGHFALGNLARGEGKMSESQRHFTNALRLLGGYQANDPLPESDGLTAGRLTETITSTMEAETTP